MFSYINFENLIELLLKRLEFLDNATLRDGSSKVKVCQKGLLSVF
jgi:hypothetical protein